MKRLIFFLLFTIGCIYKTGAQSASIDSTQFLFKNFENGVVYYKDGRQFDVQMNYSLLIKKFLFLDKYDNNRIKEFLEPEMVSTIKIGERLFLPSKGGATEVLQMQPPIFVQYKGSIEWEGKQAGYGGRTETSAIDSYSTYQSGGTIHKLETEKLVLNRINKIYRIERNGKQYRFITEKQFLKAFPEHKVVLKKYIKENKLNFNAVDDVLQLYNYAVTL